MFKIKIVKTLGTSIVSILIFSQTAMAAPATIYYQNPAGQYTSVDYLNALTNASTKAALVDGLTAAELGNLPIYVTDTNGKTVDYMTALNKNESYMTAITDSDVNNAVPPVAPPVTDTNY